ncbi:MAG: hypothetical protein AAF443_00890 [Chlamydiota bacterium]
MSIQFSQSLCNTISSYEFNHGREKYDPKRTTFDEYINKFATSLIEDTKYESDSSCKERIISYLLTKNEKEIEAFISTIAFQKKSEIYMKQTSQGMELMVENRMRKSHYQ